MRTFTSHAGCGAADIMEALGLPLSDLYNRRLSNESVGPALHSHTTHTRKSPELSSLSQFPSAFYPAGAMLHNIGEPSERKWVVTV